MPSPTSEAVRPRRPRLRVAAVLAASALALTACGSGSSADLVSPVEAASLVDSGVTVIDVRTPGEFATGHIQGAVNVDVESGSFEEAIAAYPTGDDYLVYCRSGNRSRTATDVMGDQGFESVSELDGGIVAWTSAGYPLVS